MIDTPAAVAHVPGFSGQQVPLWILRFDKNGTCTSPRHRDAMLDSIRDGGYEDVILYSHGWNTDWEHALKLYTGFLSGVGAMATARGLSARVLFVGITWPSAALVWKSEAGPDLASGGPGGANAGEVPDDDPEPDDLAILTEDMEAGRAEALRSLVADKGTLDADEVERLSALLYPDIAEAPDGDDPLDSGDFTEADLAHLLLVAGGASGGTGSAPDSGFSGDAGADDGAAPVNGDPAIAGGVRDGFGLRKLLRVTTVLKMKDRAGVVGAGLGPVLGSILDDTGARLHLVGHSYGTKVVMTALCRSGAGRPARSALLMQPAVNIFAFAAEIAGRPGGFRPALGLTERALLVTHSQNDIPLRSLFHLAARRKRDLGEPLAAARVSQYAAMGGYGPFGLGAGELARAAMPAGTGNYPGSGGAEVLSLDATGRILGHGDVTKPVTFRAMIENMA